MNGRIATVMVHTSPLDQPGIGDAGGMNIYVLESAQRMAAMGVSVDIFTRRTDVSQADIVEISVADQGIGIPEEELDRIFERFYRVDPARSRETGGTGLGLSIVKHVATKHGGEVKVWSSENVGSTFSLRLPIYSANEESAQ